MTAAHLLEAEGISKYYGNVVALSDISMHVNAGEVTCILGDNGAGKSSFIKILSGVHQPDEGRLLVDGEEVHFTLAARRACEGDRDRLPGSGDGAADVGLAELLPRRRAAQGLRPAGLARRGDGEADLPPGAREMGIDIRDPDQPVGTLSGGERQSVAIARAVYFGARVLILDEPTSALGVKQAGVVLKYILQARDRGVAVIFITHNPHHAYPVGDRFVILNRGQSLGTFAKSEIDRQELVRQMAGGRELAELEHELAAIRGRRFMRLTAAQALVRFLAVAVRRARRRRAPLLRRLLRDLRARQRRGYRRGAVREPRAPHLLPGPQRAGDGARGGRLRADAKPARDARLHDARSGPGRPTWSPAPRSPR